MPLLLRVENGWLHLPTGEAFACRVGRAGLVDAAQKREGDLKTPRGIYALRAGYYRADRLPAAPETALPLRPTTRQDGWCDDPAHPDYNRAVTLPHPARHELLWREDGVYDVIVPLGYNDGEDGPIEAGKGSAIFLHVARPDGVGTEGCLALVLPDLLTVLRACDGATRVTIG